MALTEQEGLLIAGLVSDPAYILLMEKLQYVVDNLTDKLHVASAETAADIMPLWKALRTVYIELKNTPEEIVEWLDALQQREVTSLPHNIKTGEQLQAFLKELKNQQDSIAEPEVLHPMHTGTSPNVNSFGNII